MKTVVDYVKNKVKQNFFNAFTSCIAVSILSFVILIFILFPMMLSNFSGIVGICINFFAILISLCFVFMLHYGFFVIIGKIYKNEYAVLGNIFDGFRDFKRIFPFAFIFALLFFCGSLIISFCFDIEIASIDEQVLSTLSFEDLSSYITINAFWVKVLVFYCVIALVFVIFSCFVWCILAEKREETKVISVFKQSFYTLKGKLFKFFALLFHCCGIPLLSLIVSLSVSYLSVFFAIPDFIVQIAHFAYTAFYFFLIIRFVFALWAFYCREQGSFLLLSDSNKEIAQNDTVLGLEDASKEVCVDDEK